MSSVNVKINPTGNLQLGGGAVVLESDLSLNGVQPSQIQGVLNLVPDTDVMAYRDEATFKADYNLEIGTDVQAQSGLLQNVADLALTDGDLIQYSGAQLTNITVASLRSQLGIKDNNVYSATTTDATQTPLNLDVIAVSNTADVEVFVSAHSSDSDYAAWRAKFVVFRGATGDGSIISTQNITLEGEAGALHPQADVSFDVTTGGQLRAQVTGVDATTINWDVSTRVYSAGH